ncbi:MAG: tyrosine--tRNA ligase [Candidatus Saccharimonadales bacterium]
MGSLQDDILGDNMTIKLSDDLVWRGQIKDRTFDDITLLDDPKTFYLGVDCASSDSMTIGNLALFMLARRLLDYGWKTILLVGGATSLIGDPGGKDEERQLKSREQIQANVNGIKSQVEQLFAGQDFTLVDNYDWLKDVGYIEFLRDVGKHYSMTELMQRDYIASRIGEGGTGISYAEFSYSLLQGYDFWHLYKELGVVLQIGGSDQWGNILSGVPLIRKKENAEVNGLSAPLVIDKTTGRKFGKSEAGAIWLDSSKTSVYSFYQFWLNTDDDGVRDYIKIYTLLPKETIEHILSDFDTNPGARLAQKTLAYEVTKIVHGEERADAAKQATNALFGDGAFLELEQDSLEVLRSELGAYKSGDDLTQTLVDAGLASSKTEAARFIGSGAVSVNGQKIDSDNITCLVNGANLLKRGKNSFVIVEHT